MLNKEISKVNVEIVNIVSERRNLIKGKRIPLDGSRYILNIKLNFFPDNRNLLNAKIILLTSSRNLRNAEIRSSKTSKNELELKIFFLTYPIIKFVLYSRRSGNKVLHWFPTPTLVPSATHMCPHLRLGHKQCVALETRVRLGNQYAALFPFRREMSTNFMIVVLKSRILHSWI